MQYDWTKLQKYCVAIANEGGGALILGVEDAPPRRVVGTAAFQNPVETAERLYQALHFRVDIETVVHPDGRVLVFTIPGRPQGTAYSFEGSYLMRVGQAQVGMSDDRLRAIFDEGKPDWLSQSAMKGCDDALVVQLLDTQSYFVLFTGVSRDKAGGAGQIRTREADTAHWRDMDNHKSRGYSVCQKAGAVRQVGAQSASRDRVRGD